MKKYLKNTGGITLISLVITIIILLILAGISISTLTNQGLFTRAEEAKRKAEIADIKEQIQLDIYEEQLKPTNMGTITESQLKTILEKYGTINYKEDGATIKGIISKKGQYEIAIEDIYSEKVEETTPTNPTLVSQLTNASTYGYDVTNYSVTINGTTIDKWSVFYNDGNNIYIITDDNLPSTTYNSNEVTISKLEDANFWNSFVDTKAVGKSGTLATAKGGPTAEMLVASYNAKTGKNLTLGQKLETTDSLYQNGSYLYFTTTKSSGTTGNIKMNNEIVGVKQELGKVAKVTSSSSVFSNSSLGTVPLFKTAATSCTHEGRYDMICVRNGYYTETCFEDDSRINKLTLFSLFTI